MENINWETVIVTIVGSGLITALVNGLINHMTSIKTIKESGLYKKRAEAIDEMIKVLENLNIRIQQMIDPIQTEGSEKHERDRRDAVIEAFNSFSTVFQTKQHYLPEKTAAKLLIIRVKYSQIISKYEIRVRPSENPSNMEEWDKVLAMSNDLQPLIGKLKNDFRKLMGVK